MISAIYFYATEQDLHNIFRAVEQEFAIKYCANYVYAQSDEAGKPVTEFHTIDEIVDSRGELYWIVQRTQEMETRCQTVNIKTGARYITECPDDGYLTFRTKYENPNGYEADYEVYIPRARETEFSGLLFKKIVREVKRNCVKIKHVAAFYVGEEIYRNIRQYVFYGQRDRFPMVVTEADEAKRWWDSPVVRQFMDNPIREQLPFLQEVFARKRLKDFEDKDRRDWSDEEEIYEGILYKLSLNEDLSLLADIAALFDDSVTIKEPFYVAKTVMEELRDIEIDWWAFPQKADGIRALLESLKYVPPAGYVCGNQEVIKTLLKKKYYETFRESLPGVTEETRELIRNTIAGISDKRLQKQVGEVLELLGKGKT